MEYEYDNVDDHKELKMGILSPVAAMISAQRELDRKANLVITPTLQDGILALFRETKQKYYADFTKPDMCSKIPPQDFEEWGFWHVACNFIFSQLTLAHRKNHMEIYAGFPEIAELKVGLFLETKDHSLFMSIAKRIFGGIDDEN